MTSNNYYVDEYTRLINRISLNEQNIDNLVAKISEKTGNDNNKNKKQLALVAAAVAVTVLGVKFLAEINKKIWFCEDKDYETD